MKITLKAIPLVVALGLSGCSQQSVDELIAKATQNISNGQSSEATIALKNAIQRSPDNANARFLLGKIYVEQGASQSAEKELLKALELGFEQNQVLPLLVNAYSLQYKNAEIIELVEKAKNLTPDVETTLLLYQALAYFQTEKPYKAKQAISRANELSADSIYSQLGNAYLAFSDKQIDESLAKTNKLLDNDPELPEAVLLKAQLATIKGDTQLAVDSFEKYSKLLPQLLQAKVFLANAYVKNKQYEKSEKILDQLLKINSNQPFLNQLKGLVRYQAKDYVNAKLYTERAIQNGLDTTPNRIIAGVSAYQQKNYEQAYQHIYQIKNKLPAKHPILKMLAMLELKLGNSVDASLTLTKLDGLSEDDVILLSAASAQLMREGQSKQVQSLLDKVDSLEFTSPLRLAQKGLLRLSLNDLEGLTDLEQALAMDPEQATANTELAKAYIDNAMFDKALELANTWIAQKPQEVNGYILSAVAYAKMAKTAQAESMYNKALDIDPANIAANLYYADKEVAANNRAKAIEYLQRILDANPEYIPVLGKYFVLQRELGNAEAGLKTLEKVYNASPDKMQFRLLYAQALFTDKRYSKCIAVLEPLTPDENSPDNYWIVLGNAYFNSLQFDKTILLAEQWVKVRPNSRDAYLRLISVLETTGDNSKALAAVQSALLKFPEDPQFGMLVTYFNLATNDVKAAEQSYKILSTEVKNSVAGQGLSGQILLEKHQPKEALTKLQAFYQQSPGSKNAALVARALKDMQQYDEAIAFLQQHQKQQGESVVAAVQIGEIAIIKNDFTLAAQQYQQVLKTEPDNLRALNNLAYILIERGNYKEALVYAKQAATLKPDYPAILDTYGTTLFKTGQYSEAVKVFDKVYNLETKNIAVAIRYAEALIAAKENQKAEKLLATLTTNDQTLKSEIQRLKQQI